MSFVPTVARLVSRYGKTVTLKNPGEVNLDMASGAVTRTYTSKTLRALLLPVNTQGAAFTGDTTGSRFGYGGLYTTGEIRVIVTLKALSDFEITLDTVLVYGGKNYFVSKLDNGLEEYLDLIFKTVDEIDLAEETVRPDPTTLGVQTQ